MSGAFPGHRSPVRPAPAAPGLDVATLCDGDYVLGVAALLNSLVSAGFRGDLHVGHRGPLPTWFDGQGPGVPHRVAEGVRVVAWPLAPGRHLTQLKADLLGTLLARVDAPVGVAYADVVVPDCGFLADWDRYTRAMAERGPGHLAGPEAAGGVGRRSPFQVPDQDALNLALMRHDELASVVGPQGMGFAPGWRVLAHSTGTVKPWRRRPVADGLRGVPFDANERAFLAHAAGPVHEVVPPGRLRLHRGAAGADRLLRRLRGCSGH